MRITKTVFVQGSRCPKYLWLSRNKQDVCADGDNSHTEDGERVGKLARTYFGAAKLIPYASPTAMAKETKALLAEASVTICEASFEAEDLFCAADIVRTKPDGSLDIYEVKSSTSIKGKQLDDVAFQYHVIKEAGYSVSSFNIMHLNGEYERHGALNLGQLFKIEDVTDVLIAMQSDIESSIEMCRAGLYANGEPACELSCACEKDFPCPCLAYCRELHKVPEKSVFDLPGVPATKKYKLYSQGIITPDEMAMSKCLTERQRFIVSSMLEDESVERMDESKLTSFLSSIRYPLYLLDFETFQQAIPEFDGVRPYEQIPFQYSLHWLESPRGVLHHEEYLGTPGEDPRYCLSKKLCNDIPIGATVMAYNAKFETMVIKNLGQLYPNLSLHLSSMVENMMDLMIPFQQRWYYIGKMHGSFSIKAVLPAMCPGDKDLDYHALPVVHNGTETMQRYATLGDVTDKKKLAYIRAGMLAYCCLDTLAMVKILERLWNIVAVGGIAA